MAGPEAVCGAWGQMRRHREGHRRRLGSWAVCGLGEGGLPHFAGRRVAVRPLAEGEGDKSGWGDKEKYQVKPEHTTEKHNILFSISN